MKNLLIFIIALTLVFAACATSQNGITDKTASDGVKAAPGQGGVQASTGPKPIETKSMVLFSDGSVDEYTTTDYDSSYTNIVNQKRYSASGALLEQVEYTYQEGKGWLTAKTTRDVENQLKNQVAYQYDDRGQLKRETLINKAGKTISSYTSDYDNSGNRVSRVVFSGTGIKLAETIYVYNANGTLVSSETKDGTGRNIGSTLNQYDAQGNLINQKVMNMDGQVATVINAVWRNGYEVENEQTDPNGAVQLKVTNEYGAGGELLKKTVMNFQGKIIQILRYEYL
jgi:YD repeat-containing protein